jgi:hypothetical protein
MKLTKILTEIQVNKPGKPFFNFIKNNIKEIIELSGSEEYVHLEIPYEIITPEEQGWSMFGEDDGDWDRSKEYYIICNTDDKDDCLQILITNDMKVNLEGDGPVGNGYPFKVKNVDFQVQHMAC